MDPTNRVGMCLQTKTGFLLRHRFVDWLTCCLAIAGLALAASPSRAAPAPAVNLFDTRSPSEHALAGTTLIKPTDWTKIPEETTAHRFAGDAVLQNNRLALVLRRGAPGAELYAVGSSEAALRAVLAPGGKAVRIASVAVVENSPSEAVLEAAFQAGDGKALKVRYSLAMGQSCVRTESAGGAVALSIQAPSRFIVLPDFFADDIAIDARELKVSAAELPSENFLLHLLPGGDSIVMAVCSQRGNDARVELSGNEADRRIVRSELDYGKDGKVWVALLEGQRIWHECQVAGSDTGKVMPLQWSPPFPAQWRVDWRQGDGLTGSWEMLWQRAGGDYEKPGWFGEPGSVPPDRKRWTTVLGRFEYPCWVDKQGCGFLQPLKSKAVRFEGPALIYPINRSRATSLANLTVVDIVRSTLGVGPCEYILDVEAQGAAMKGRSTCGTRDALKAIYTAKQQRQRRAEAEKILDEVVVFVKHIRSRIDQYVQFGRELTAYLNQQKAARPELGSFLTEMELLASAMESDFNKRKDNIRTPQYVVDLTDKFRREVLDDTSDNAIKNCKAITEAIVVVGGNQDELVGECRRDVRVLRQRAGLALATDPRTAEIAKEIRRRTQTALRNASSYEAPRH